MALWFLCFNTEGSVYVLESLITMNVCVHEHQGRGDVDLKSQMVEILWQTVHSHRIMLKMVIWRSTARCFSWLIIHKYIRYSLIQDLLRSEAYHAAQSIVCRNGTKQEQTKQKGTWSVQKRLFLIIYWALSLLNQSTYSWSPQLLFSKSHFSFSHYSCFYNFLSFCFALDFHKGEDISDLSVFDFYHILHLVCYWLKLHCQIKLISPDKWFSIY